MNLIRRAALGLLASGVAAAGLFVAAAPASAATTYTVTTFANAPGYSSPGGTQTGTLYAGTNYVYCKVWGPQVGSGSAYNHWWLKTDLDTGSPWQNQYVSAYYLSLWGNDEAKDNSGVVIPDCGTTATYQMASYSFQAQINGYYCGPAATRIALTAAGLYYDQNTIAGWLGTTVNGTDHIGLVKNALNAHDTSRTYGTRNIPWPYNSGHKEQLRSDIINTILNRGRVVVANVLGTGIDTNGTYHTYSGGHYLPIVGYKVSDNAETVVIDDNALGSNHLYYMDLDQLVDWIANKGYSYAI